MGACGKGWSWQEAPKVLLNRNLKGGVDFNRNFSPKLLHPRGKFASKSPGLLGPRSILLNLLTRRKEHLRKYLSWGGAPSAVSVDWKVALMGAGGERERKSESEKERAIWRRREWFRP